jgi:DnaK suppressor protein
MSMATGNHWHGADREELRSLLAARRRQLTEDLHLRIERIRENGSHTPLGQEPDDGDPCDLDVRLMEIATATLRRIDVAIERLDEGRYGRCTRCLAPISEARLRAMPFAVCCQRCETAHEREAAARADARKRPLWAEGQCANE